LLPVCSVCKRIRIDPRTPEESERWVSLENYLHQEAAVRFTHGICKQCLPLVFPDLAEEMDAEDTSGTASPDPKIPN